MDIDEKLALLDGRGADAEYDAVKALSVLGLEFPKLLLAKYRNSKSGVSVCRVFIMLPSMHLPVRMLMSLLLRRLRINLKGSVIKLACFLPSLKSLAH